MDSHCIFRHPGYRARRYIYNLFPCSYDQRSFWI